MNAKDYLINNGLADTSIDILDYLTDDSDYIKGNFYSNTALISPNQVRLKAFLPNLRIGLNDEYSNHYLTVVNVYDLDKSEPYIDIGGIEGEMHYDFTVPFDNEKDVYFFIITPRPFVEYQNQETGDLFLDELVVAFGITLLPIVFEEGEPADEGEPPEEVPNPDSTQSITVLDADAENVYSIVPDVFDVKISQSINGPYTLSFKLLPYTNASNIYTPRIIECDGDYFHVQRITKRRQLQNLEMDVECEHVSYELNVPKPYFWNEETESYEWTEDTYQGTAGEIILEMLSGSRFTLTSDLGYVEHKFTTSTEGYRSRINEFAAYLNMEVKWTRFNVSLLPRRGHNNGLKLEVGKNIVGMTEYIETVKPGRVTRSYEIEVLDLNHVTDESNRPLELYDIKLGDTLTLIDNNYLINRTDRVISIEYDPFKKALPNIELANGVASFTKSDYSSKPATVDGKKMSVDYVIEAGRTEIYARTFFEFTRPYDRVISVQLTLSDTYVSGNNGGTVYYELHWVNSKCTGVFVVPTGVPIQDCEVSMTAICDPFEYATPN
jgi:hypothetical protein